MSKLQIHALSLIFGLSILGSNSAHAEKSITCESIHHGAEVQTFITMGELEFITKIEASMDGERFVVYDSEDKKDTIQATYFASKKNIEDSSLLTMLARPFKSGEAESYVVQTISEYEGNLEETMEGISDDASGIVLLSAVGKDQKVSERSLMLGWGGVFVNCR